MVKFMAAAAVAAACLSAPCSAADGQSDTKGYAVVGKIPGADGGWDYASIDPEHSRLFVARGAAIMMVDLATRKVTDSLTDAKHGHAALILSDHVTLLATDGDSGTARLVSAQNGALIASFDTGRKPDAAFEDPATGLLAIMNAGDGSVSLIDPKTKALVGSIAVGGGLEFGVPDGRGLAYVNVEDGNAIAVIDLKTRTKTSTITLPGCEGPTGLGLVSGRARLISACANNVAVIVDPVAHKVVGTLAIGANPDAVIVDEARHRAFIPSGNSGTLAVIDTANPNKIRVIETVQTQVGAKTGALDPRDGHIFLPTATMAPPEPGAKRGKPIPGTFVILEVAPASQMKDHS